MSYSPWGHKELDMRAQQHITDERCFHPQGYFHFGRNILAPVTLNPKEKTPSAGYSAFGVGQSMTHLRQELLFGFFKFF